jgi:imidazolonepropionase-like amidohydrolase
MKNLALILCLTPFVCAYPQSSTVAIRDVTVVDVRDGALHPGQTVLVAGNRIAAVGPTREVATPHAEVVEATGRYIIPGLWDMHVHSVANVALDRAIESVAAHEWHFPLFLAHGVTGVRNMNDGTGDATLELTKSVRRQLAEGNLRGPPRFLTAGPSVDGDPPLGSNPVIVRTAAKARAAVDQLASNGADLIKVYENVSREVYFAIIDEARRRKIPVDGHVPFRVTAAEVADAGQRTVEHPDALAAGCSTAAEAERNRFAKVLADYNSLRESEKFLAMFRHVRALYDTRDPVACASAIEAYRRNGVAVTADLLAYHHVVHAEQVLANADRMRLVPREIRRNWEKWLDSDGAREFQSILRPIVPLELDNVRLLNEAGVLLLAESLGTVEPGKLADLVLLDANPLENIRNTRKIRAVVANGRLYRRADLDQLLAASRR